MSVGPMYVIAELTVAASLATIVVGLTRKPLRHFAGAQVGYLLWLLVPASALVVSLPAPTQSLEAASLIFPRLVLGAFPSAMSSENYVHAGADYAVVGVIVWASGSVLMLAFMVTRQTAFIHSLRNVTAAEDGTYRSASVTGPVLVGIWRPRIVLPIDFEIRYTPEERTFVLAHEEAHKKRFDVLVNAIATVWLCLFWFNPLMYWAIARLRFDQELACDAAVFAASDTGRRRYAQALLKTQLAADSAWRMPIGCHWQSSHPLKERVAMLKRPLPRFPRRLFGVVLTSVLVTSGSYVVWAAQPEPGNAREQQLEDVQLAISADRVSMLENGDIDYSGNVFIRSQTTDRAPRVTLTPGTINHRPDGSTVLGGAVQFFFADRVLRTDRAIIEKDGTIRMDSVRVSPISKSR
jgi:beta-lactamase regulating signal transducer with metallopeptidase domain